jgi:ureidoacrylate peracid hydrolase
MADLLHHAAHRMVEIAARPAPIAIDTTQTAVIVVDMQNDFGSPGGMFDRAGIDLSPFQRAVSPTAKVLAAARDAGITVVYLKMAFRPDLSDLGPPGAPNRERHLQVFHVGETIHSPDGSESRILIRDTWNTDIVPELAPQPGDIVLYKHRFSGFFETELHQVLQRLDIHYLIMTGCTTSVCVESTIRDAMFRDYSCVLLADCTGEPIGADLQRSNHDASLLSVEVLLGWVSDADTFMQALGSS